VKDIKKHFNKNNFNNAVFCTLAQNITKENQDASREKLLKYTKNELEKYNIPHDELSLQDWINNIPIYDVEKIDYRSKFNHWQKHKGNITDKDIKVRLQINFNFPPSLWTSILRDEAEIILSQKVQEYIKRKTEDEIDILSELRDYFSDSKVLSESQNDEINQIRGMSEREIMDYISPKYPLSQAFLLKLIPVLYKKGYYELLISDGIDMLEPHLLSDNIKRLYAHALGSTKIGNYMKAYNVLDTLSSDGDTEIIDMRTEAISNMRREQLINKCESLEEAKKIIKILIKAYESVFNHTSVKYYYTGINLAYMIKLASILFPNEKLSAFTIPSIANLVKDSIRSDKESIEFETKYYAHITELEFLLLHDQRIVRNEFDKYLYNNRSSIDTQELFRTQRQMQLFIAIINKFSINYDLKNIVSIVKLFDEYIENLEVFSI
jgi:hypothetical protein